MATLLFEIGTEELPSWYVTQGREALAALAAERLEAARLPFGGVEAYATPRRLAILVRDLADASERRVERRRGPAASVAFGEDGAPSAAAVGFARGQGVAPEALVVEETDKGAYVFAEVATGGVPAAELLPELLAGLVRDLPAPRKMRWGEVETPFVRPVAWLTARLDDAVVPVEVAGRRAEGGTYGHRVHAPGAVALDAPEGYVAALRDAWVMVDPDARRTATREAVAAAAEAEGLTPAWTDALLDEVVDLVEWPVAILGRFDARYLALPDVVLSTVMIHHQRFVPLARPDGALADAFVGVSNTDPRDPAVVRRGYEAVLDGRLYDARFFWDADRGSTLAHHAWGLSGIAFQRDLGTIADKVARVGVGVERLADRLGVPDDVRRTVEAARPLLRADAATEMVGELPELAGEMGRAYALEEGLPEPVAQALLDGVRPTTAGGTLPEGEAGALLAAADRADTLLGFFALGKRPSGSADPFALRRAAGALARIAAHRAWDVPLRDLVAAVAGAYDGGPVEVDDGVVDAVTAFTWERVAQLLAAEGVDVLAVRAATADGPSVIEAARRAHLLVALEGSATFAALRATYKRAANLADGAPEGVAVDPERFETPEAEALHAALGPARDAVAALRAEVGEQLPPWSLGAGPTQPPAPGAGA
ncbi:MAG: glycine--tRNA ligase subunit beta, partial [Trueperaceae bacterium]|nr:glycine--tRNA ligase subunit beta [Trueperaceae bacterium]